MLSSTKSWMLKNVSCCWHLPLTQRTGAYLRWYQSALMSLLAWLDHSASAWTIWVIKYSFRGSQRNMMPNIHLKTALVLKCHIMWMFSIVFAPLICIFSLLLATVISLIIRISKCLFAYSQFTIHNKQMFICLLLTVEIWAVNRYCAL